MRADRSSLLAGYHRSGSSLGEGTALPTGCQLPQVPCKAPPRGGAGWRGAYGPAPLGPHRPVRLRERRKARASNASGFACPLLDARCSRSPDAFTSSVSTARRPAGTAVNDIGARPVSPACWAWSRAPGSARCRGLCRWCVLCRCLKGWMHEQELHVLGIRQHHCMLLPQSALVARKARSLGHKRAAAARAEHCAVLTVYGRRRSACPVPVRRLARGCQGPPSDGLMLGPRAGAAGRWALRHRCATSCLHPVSM